MTSITGTVFSLPASQEGTGLSPPRHSYANCSLLKGGKFSLSTMALNKAPKGMISMAARIAQETLLTSY